MKKLFKLLFLVLFVAVVAAVVAAVVSRKKFESMSDEEIRAFLAEKLEGKVDEAQLAGIQDAVIAGVRARSSNDHYADDVEAAVHDLEAVADEAAAEMAEAAESAVESVKDAAGDAAEELEVVVEAATDDD